MRVDLKFYAANNAAYFMSKVFRKMRFPSSICRHFNLMRHKAVMSKIMVYLEEAKSRVSLSASSSTKDRIWVFWWQGQEAMPKLVKDCYISLLENAHRRVILVTKDNYSEYTTLQEHEVAAFESGKISIAHFSDIVRFKKPWRAMVGCDHVLRVAAVF